MSEELSPIKFELPNSAQIALESGSMSADEAFTLGITDIMLHPRNYDFHADPGNKFLVPYFIEMLKAAGNHGVNLPQILPDIIRNVKEHCDMSDMKYASQGRESQYHPNGGNKGLARAIEPITLYPLENTSLLFHFLEGKLNRTTHKQSDEFERGVLAPGQTQMFKARHEAYQRIKNT